MFTTMAVSSFSSGALVSSAGWEMMNYCALPLLALVPARCSGMRGCAVRPVPA